MPTTPAGRPSRLHHHAFVLQDQERTRRFYEELLGIPLVATWCEDDEVAGTRRAYCHTFYELADGGALAFFQFADPSDGERFRAAPRSPFDHLALRVDATTQAAVARRLGEAGVRFQEIEHGYSHSLYVQDPDGLILELTVDAPEIEEIIRVRRADAHAELRRWLSGDHRSNNRWRRDVPPVTAA
jgi:catechol 2,3-dioxygenase-like lactoylglutathione lyase family enzyme